ncbi:hypothetical protein COHA_008747 [Chlorella ohadii]|nr:hypothetical protein COHA_008747 [Chlorella ohadii]
MMRGTLILAALVLAAVTRFLARAVRGATTVVPSSIKWSTAASGRVVISFPAADFASKAAGAYSFAAAAVNANGEGPYCSPAVAWTLGRPAAPKITAGAVACEYVRLTYTLPAGSIVGQTGFELLVTLGSGSIKVEPYKTEIFASIRYLYFPAAAFPAAALSLKLAIKSSLGVGAYSSAFALTRTACQTTITQLQAKVTQQQTDLGRCSTACKALPELGSFVTKEVSPFYYRVFYQLYAVQIIPPSDSNPNLEEILLGNFNEAASTRTVHKFTNGDSCNGTPRQATVT